jgi:hypothetical protein
MRSRWLAYCLNTDVNAGKISKIAKKINLKLQSHTNTATTVYNEHVWQLTPEMSSVINFIYSMFGL